jgi:TatD DNase family protein
MPLIDTHAHLDDRKYDDDREAVVERAMEAGVESIVTVGADLSSSRSAVALADRWEQVWATVGVHPHDAESLDRRTLDELRKLVGHPRVVAVGEIGLDFYRTLSSRAAQRAAFRDQLDLAAAAGKPVVIHIRDQEGHVEAYDEALRLLEQWASGLNDRPRMANGRLALGVLHCFSGDLGTAQQAIEMGFCIGVDGPITYRNAGALRGLVAQLPLDRLVLETDCPYLTPQPRRGRRNEPAYLPYIAEKVAEVKGMDVGRVVEQTTQTAVALLHSGGDWPHDSTRSGM